VGDLDNDDPFDKNKGLLKTLYKTNLSFPYELNILQRDKVSALRTSGLLRQLSLNSGAGVLFAGPAPDGVRGNERRERQSNADDEQKEQL
jgi:hypothetical protein